MHARGSHRCGGSEASEVHVRCAGTRALFIGTRCGREARGSRRSIVRNGKTEPAQTLVGLLPPFQIDSKLARGGNHGSRRPPPAISRAVQVRVIIVRTGGQLLGPPRH
jgi:hypothetical protein